MGAWTSLACDRGVSVAVDDSTLCIVFRGPHSDQYPAEATLWFERALEVVTGPELSLVILIEDCAESPDAVARRSYSNALSEFRAEIGAYAQVIVSEGLKGAAFRAICSTIFLLSRSNGNSKVFSDASDAARWIAESNSGRSTSPEALDAFIDDVRRA
ncbi:MAG: hypothetical protein ACE37F_33050 [Nannocystaceae bacterium]|nr:hypothetical protein [bacterium]